MDSDGNNLMVLVGDAGAVSGYTRDQGGGNSAKAIFSSEYFHLFQT